MSNERGQRIPGSVTEMADKLDAILLYLSNIQTGSALGDATDRLLHHLLGVFEDGCCLPASKFVQFLYFIRPSQRAIRSGLLPAAGWVFSRRGPGL